MLLSGDHIDGLLAAFGFGSTGRLSDGPVASGRLGSIWRLDTDGGSWAVKQVGDASQADLTEVLEGAEFQEAALAAGIATPAIRRTRADAVIADLGDGVRARVHTWVVLEAPDVGLDPVELGRLVAALHQVDVTGTIGTDPWYAEPVGGRRWAEIIRDLRARQAPFVDQLDALIPELVGLERFLGEPPHALRTCHRDLWADNLRRTPTGGLCVIDFDNAGLADPSQELAQVLVEYATADPRRAPVISAAYAEVGGPGRVEHPRDFAMAIAQLAHIAAEGCRRWLASTTDAGRADNEGWVREYLERPLTRDDIEALLAR